ncbi:hypothetical protein [Burkholderia ubonensis]|uniref:hypothetical protein n=2 Tax=Burkholderia ubonensis TaxID=101571 RepID=UPI000A803FB2|nr:hypothetical protein [Burkholderia ubonensis]
MLLNRLGQYMTTNWDLVSKLVFPVVTALIVAAIGRRLEYRPKLVTYLAHAAGFALPPVEGPAAALQEGVGAGQAPAAAAPGGPIHVHGVVVRNTGRKTAFNVRIGHNAKVHHYVLEPQVQHEMKDAPNGGWEIIIPALVPNEQVLISYLYFPPVIWRQVNTYTKSDEGMARYLNVLPTPQPPRWLANGFLSFFYLGIAGTVYALISTIQWYVAVSQLIVTH